MGRKRKPRRRDSAGRFVVEPTKERLAHNDFERVGLAHKAVPPIARLFRQGNLTKEEFDALGYYRDQANLANQSPVRSCIDFSPKGGGNGPGAAITSARRELSRIEAALGPYLSRLLECIVRDDMEVDKWVRAEYDPAGPEHWGVTLMELKYAAGGIVR